MTPAGLVIRPAEEADLGRLVQLLVLGAVPGGPPSTEDPHDLAPYRDAWRHIAEAADGAAVLVAVIAGEVVGVCQLIVFRHLQARGGLCAELESVHVHPDHRGTGVGGELVRAAIDRARDLGCYRVQLTSNAARHEAHRFYEGLGFEASHVGFKLRLR
jgi:GNAT superfamily N-acetyltransferase